MDSAMQIVKQMEVAAARVAHLKAPRGKALAVVEAILKGGK